MTATSVTEPQTPTGRASTAVGHASAGHSFSADIAGLPAAFPTRTVRLSDGAVDDLCVTAVPRLTVPLSPRTVHDTNPKEACWQ